MSQNLRAMGCCYWNPIQVYFVVVLAFQPSYQVDGRSVWRRNRGDEFDGVTLGVCRDTYGGRDISTNPSTGRCRCPESNPTYGSTAKGEPARCQTMNGFCNETLYGEAVFFWKDVPEELDLTPNGPCFPQAPHLIIDRWLPDGTWDTIPSSTSCPSIAFWESFARISRSNNQCLTGELIRVKYNCSAEENCFLMKIKGQKILPEPTSVSSNHVPSPSSSFSSALSIVQLLPSVISSVEEQSMATQTQWRTSVLVSIAVGIGTTPVSVREIASDDSNAGMLAAVFSSVFLVLFILFILLLRRNKLIRPCSKSSERKPRQPIGRVNNSTYDDTSERGRGMTIPSNHYEDVPALPVTHEYALVGDTAFGYHKDDTSATAGAVHTNVANRPKSLENTGENPQPLYNVLEREDDKNAAPIHYEEISAQHLKERSHYKQPRQ